MNKLVGQIIFLVVSIIFLIVPSTCAATGNSIKFRLVRDYLIVVPVNINDSETLEFMIDTGTNTSLILPSAAARLKLRPIDRIEMTAANNSAIAAPRSFLEKLSLNDNAAEKVEVLWAEIPELRRLDSRISGILGQNFLAQFNFTLDYAERRINFGAADKNFVEKNVRLNFGAEENVLLLTAKVGGENCRFLLDSAAPSLILFAQGAQKLHSQIDSGEQTLRVSTVAGRNTTQSGFLKRLQIGDYALRLLPVALLSDVARAEDGLLPTKMFKAIYFNHKERYVILQK